MKVKDIVEGDVVSFGSPPKETERAYGVGGYEKGAPVLQAFRDLLAQKKASNQTIQVLNRKPEVKAKKRPAEGFLRQIFQSLPADLQPSPYDSSVHSNFLKGETHLDIEVYVNQKMQKELKKVDPKMAERILDTWGRRIAERVAEALGYYIQDITYRTEPAWGRYPPRVSIEIENVTDKYFEDAGVDRSKILPSIEDKIRSLFKDHNIGGLGIIWVDKQKTGYRIKVEGAERVDEKSFRRLVAALRTSFGDDFIKMTMDRGELTSIGHRPVGPGLTNYRIWLSHNIKGQHRLS